MPPRRRHTPTAQAVIEFVAAAVALGYDRHPDLEIPVPGPYFAEQLETVIAAAASGMDAPVRGDTVPAGDLHACALQPGRLGQGLGVDQAGVARVGPRPTYDRQCVRTAGRRADTSWTIAGSRSPCGCRCWSGRMPESRSRSWSWGRNGRLRPARGCPRSG